MRSVCLVVGVVFVSACAHQMVRVPADDPLVARVGNTELHKSDLVFAMSQLPPPTRDMPFAPYFRGLLDQAVARRLVAEAARPLDLTDHPDVKKRIAFLTEQAVGQAYMDRVRAAAVTDDTLQAAYRRRVEAFTAKSGDKEEYNLRHITVPTAEEAKAIIGQLKGGATFDDLATKGHASEPRWFIDGTFPRNVNDAVAKLPKGAFLPNPVSMDGGSYAVIQLTDRRPAQPPSFESLHEALVKEVQHDAVKAELTRLRTGTRIELFDLEGKPLAAAGLEPEEANGSPPPNPAKGLPPLH